MAREIIGTLACPECGGAAEVKKQKNGMAYRWCLDCHGQYFPRTAEASARLVAKCSPTVTAPAPAPAKADPDPKPAKPAPKAKPADPAPAPAPAKPKAAGPFDFLMNR
jgi:hypothetical protein